MRRRYFQALGIYLLRRFLWSFAFFPFFCLSDSVGAFRFNPVAMVQNILPELQIFVSADPSSSQNRRNALIAWLTIGVTFAVFADLILTPFKSPIDYEADVHARLDRNQKRNHL